MTTVPTNPALLPSAPAAPASGAPAAAVGPDPSKNLLASGGTVAENDRSAEAFMMVNDPYPSGQHAPGQPTDYL